LCDELEAIFPRGDRARNTHSGIVNVPGVMKTLHDGEPLTVDGDEGMLPWIKQEDKMKILLIQPAKARKRSWRGCFIYETLALEYLAQA